MFRRASWVLVLFFALSLAVATLLNLLLISEARRALDEGILGGKTSFPFVRYHVALVVPETRDSFFDGLITGVRAAAQGADAAVQLFRYDPADPDGAEQLFQLCLSARMDGILLFSATNDRTLDRQREASQRGSVFVPVGTQTPVGVANFIGSSRLLQGVESGHLIALRWGNAARVGILLAPDEGGTPTDDPVTRGVQSALLAYPGAQLLAVVRARSGIFSGEEAALALLKAHPGLNALVCTSAPLTDGAAQVVSDQGRAGQIQLIGTDESPSILQAIDTGVVAASIVRESQRMGAEAFAAFEHARAGKPQTTPVEVGYLVRSRP